MTGLKDRQRLALYVALGLSAGSGLMLDASTAYANDLTIPADTTTQHANGVDMGATNGNKLTIGAVGGDPADHTAPVSRMTHTGTILSSKASRPSRGAMVVSTARMRQGQSKVTASSLMAAWSMS